MFGTKYSTHLNLEFMNMENSKNIKLIIIGVMVGMVSIWDIVKVQSQTRLFETLKMRDINDSTEGKTNNSYSAFISIITE